MAVKRGLSLFYLQFDTDIIKYDENRHHVWGEGYWVITQMFYESSNP